MTFPEYGVSFVSTVVRASAGNPIVAGICVTFVYAVFCYIETLVEQHFWGARFEHKLDIVFAVIYLYFILYTMMGCAVYTDLLVRG